MKRFMRFISAVQTSIREIVGASGKSYYRPAGGSGAGNRGGQAGAIRESGGAFGERAAAEEEGYFYRKTREQLEKLKKDRAKAAKDKAKK